MSNQITHEKFVGFAIDTLKTATTWPEFYKTFEKVAAPYLTQTCADPKCHGETIQEVYDFLVKKAKYLNDQGDSPAELAMVLAYAIRMTQTAVPIIIEVVIESRKT